MPLDTVKGSKTSVYIGTFTNDFQGMQFRDNEGINSLLKDMPTKN